MSSDFVFSQDIKEIEAMRQVMPLSPQSPPAYSSLAKENKSEYEWLSSQLFLFYKSFISSQDGYRCTFHPSCSEYAIQSIKRKGAIIGLMSTFDRLVRCNGLSPELYPIDIERKVFIDHPQ